MALVPPKPSTPTCAESLKKVSDLKAKLPNLPTRAERDQIEKEESYANQICNSEAGKLRNERLPEVRQKPIERPKERNFIQRILSLDPDKALVDAIWGKISAPKKESNSK